MRLRAVLLIGVPFCLVGEKRSAIASSLHLQRKAVCLRHTQRSRGGLIVYGQGLLHLRGKAAALLGLRGLLAAQTGMIQ
jgi:hypothetical protein